MGVFTDYIEGKLADWIQKPLELDIDPMISLTFQYGYGSFEGQYFETANGDIYVVPLIEPNWFEMMPANFKESLAYKAALLYFMEEAGFTKTGLFQINIARDAKVEFCRGKEVPFAPPCFDTGVFASITFAKDNGNQKKIYIPAQIIRPPKGDSK